MHEGADVARDPAVRAAWVAGIFTVVAAIIGGAFAIIGSRPDPPALNYGAKSTVVAEVGQVTEPTTAPTLPSQPPTSPPQPLTATLTTPASAVPTPTTQLAVNPATLAQSVPGSIVGTWVGSMVAHDPSGDYQYGIAFSINSAPIGSGVIGNSSDSTQTTFGVLTCSYLLSVGTVVTDTAALVADLIVAESAPTCLSRQYLFVTANDSQSLIVKVSNTPDGDFVAESYPLLGRI